MSVYIGREDRVRAAFEYYALAAVDLRSRAYRTTRPFVIGALAVVCVGPISAALIRGRGAAYRLALTAFVGAWLAIIGAALGRRQRTRRIWEVSQRMPGFAEFERLYRRHYWPQELPAGSKHDRFVSLTGDRKGAGRRVARTT